MLSRLKERFYWPCSAKAIKNWCRSCITCATGKIPAPKRKAYFNPYRWDIPCRLSASTSRDHCQSLTRAISIYWLRWTTLPDGRNHTLLKIKKQQRLLARQLVDAEKQGLRYVVFFLQYFYSVVEQFYWFPPIHSAVFYWFPPNCTTAN